MKVTNMAWSAVAAGLFAGAVYEATSPYSDASKERVSAYATQEIKEWAGQSLARGVLRNYCNTNDCWTIDPKLVDLVSGCFRVMMSNVDGIPPADKRIGRYFDSRDPRPDSQLVFVNSKFIGVVPWGIGVADGGENCKSYAEAVTDLNHAAIELAGRVSAAIKSEQRPEVFFAVGENLMKPQQ